MTGNTGPDIRLLADLDAGLLDAATAREVRAAAEADPAARAVLDALTATRAELAALPDPPVPPALAARWSAALAVEQSRLTDAATPVGPDGVIDTEAPPPPPTSHPERPLRTPPAPCEETETVRGPAAPTSDPGNATPPPTAAIPPTAAPAEPHPSSSTPSPVVSPADQHSGAVSRANTAPHAGSGPQNRRDDPGPGRGVPGLRRDGPSPRRPPKGTRGPRRARGAARLLRRPAVLAAALLVAVAVVAGLRAGPEPLPTVGRPQLVAEALSAVGVRDTGGLDDPLRRTGCLRAVRAPVESPDAPLLGGRRVTFEGEPGVLLVLGTGRRGAFDVLIVDPDCGPGGGRLLAATRVTPP